MMWPHAWEVILHINFFYCHFMEYLDIGNWVEFYFLYGSLFCAGGVYFKYSLIKLCSLSFAWKEIYLNFYLITWCRIPNYSILQCIFSLSKHGRLETVCPSHLIGLLAISHCYYSDIGLHCICHVLSCRRHSDMFFILLNSGCVQYYTFLSLFFSILSKMWHTMARQCYFT